MSKQRERTPVGRISPDPYEYKVGSPEFGQRARRRGGRSAEEIYKSRQTVGTRVKSRTSAINKVLEGD